MAHGMTFMVAAIAMTMATLLGFAAAHSEPSTMVTIHNNFPTHNLTVQCTSNIESTHPGIMHLVLPKDVYRFFFDASVHHRWTCSLSTEKKAGNVLCSKALYSGKFIMWENHMPIPPMREPMCDRKCAWFVDGGGLSLVRHPGGKPFHIYDWPAYDYNC